MVKDCKGATVWSATLKDSIRSWVEGKEDSRPEQRGNGGLWETVRAAGICESGVPSGEKSEVHRVTAWRLAGIALRLLIGRA
jgi:hypothetical protein